MIHRSIYNFLLLNTNNFNRILNILTKTAAATTTIYNNSSNTTAGTIIININNNLSENLHCYVKYIICTPNITRLACYIYCSSPIPLETTWKNIQRFVWQTTTVQVKATPKSPTKARNWEKVCPYFYNKHIKLA